jgi:hypothetical protein
MTGHRAELLNMLATAGSTTTFTQDRRNNDGGAAAGAGQYGVANGHVDRSGTGMMVQSPTTNVTTSAQPRPSFQQNNANPDVWLSILKGT